MEQRSEEWFSARLGLVTASRIADVCAKTKSGWGAARANYMAQLIADKLTGTVAESYSNAAMQWGTDHEDEARIAYEFFSGNTVEEVGFVVHPLIAGSGASPDGLIGEAGLVEIKCPNTATHIDTLLGKNIERKYLLQMQWQMACTAREWCDFVSYDPRLPTEMQIHIQRVERDPELLAETEATVEGFLDELQDKLVALKSQYAEDSEAAQGFMMGVA